MVLPWAPHLTSSHSGRYLLMTSGSTPTNAISGNTPLSMSLLITQLFPAPMGPAVKTSHGSVGVVQWKPFMSTMWEELMRVFITVSWSD
jgi:hypothetical protein